MLDSLPTVPGSKEEYRPTWYRDVYCTDWSRTWFRECPCCGMWRMLSGTMEVGIWDGRYCLPGEERYRPLDDDGRRFLFHSPDDFMSLWWSECDILAKEKHTAEITADVANTPHHPHPRNNAEVSTDA